MTLQNLILFVNKRNNNNDNNNNNNMHCPPSGFLHFMLSLTRNIF